MTALTWPIPGIDVRSLRVSRRSEDRSLTGQEDMFGLDHINAVMAMLAEYKVPVLLDLDIGHVAPMMPLISGALAEVKLKGQEFELTHVL